MTTRIRSIIAPLLAATLTACSGGAYLKATGDFADATTASTTTLQGIASENHRLCAERAQLDYFQHRIDGTATADGSLVPDGKQIYWSEFYAKYKPNGTGVTWADHCKALAAGDALVDKGINSLSSYAAALKRVSSHDYSGTTLGTSVGDVGALVASIPPASGAASEAIKALGPSSTDPAGPIGALGGALTAGYAAHEVKIVVRGADKPVKDILAALTHYLDAVAVEESGWESDTNQALDTIDRRLDEANAAPPPQPAATPVPPAAKAPARKGAKEETPPPPPAPPAPHLSTFRPEPLRVLAFYQVATRWTRTLDATRTKHAALRDALAKLSAAEDQLMKADGADDAEKLAAVAGLVNQLLGDLAAVETAIKTGGAE